MRFGFTPDEYERLTTAQLALLAKADEQRFVQLGTAIRDAVANAIANTHRKKGKHAIPLYKKVSQGDHMGHEKAASKMAAIQAKFGGES